MKVLKTLGVELKWKHNVLSVKLIAINAHIIKEEKSHTNNLDRTE